MDALVKNEGCIFELHKPTLEHVSLKLFVDYRNLLKFKEYFFTNQETMRLLHECLVRIFCAVADYQLQHAELAPSLAFQNANLK